MNTISSFTEISTEQRYEAQMNVQFELFLNARKKIIFELTFFESVLHVLF